MCTRERLKEVLHYEPDTGVFTWKVRIAKCVKLGDEVGWDDDGGYKRVSIDCKQYRLHRLAFLYMTGEIPEQVDHINHNRGDNSWNNLASSTHKLNHKNRTLQANNTSGQSGVSWHKLMGKWRCAITVNQVRHQLGLHEDYDTAVMIRKAAEVWFGFHPNHGRD